MKTLSATQEKELFNKYIETHDKKIRDEIVLNYLYIFYTNSYLMSSYFAKNKENFMYNCQ